MENYHRLRKLGSGNFAKVYLAVHVPTRKQVALKLISKKEIDSVQMFQRVHREISNMKKVTDHPNTVSIHETFETNEHYVIAMEYLPGGELFEYVLDSEGLAENSARSMFTQIVQAVQHCHENGVTHRDLKLENILLDKDNQPKLADFGLSKETQTIPMMATYCGSPLYTSPEMLHGKPYLGPECDVWSLGVILYTMLTATMPFDDSNFPKFMNQVEKGEYPEPLGVSENVKDLVSKMLDPNGDTRYTVDDILAHPWMAKPPSPATLRSRRKGVCYDNCEDIRTSLLKLNICSCSCHKTKGDRDSVVSRHCTDCDDFVANDAELMQRRQLRISRNSSDCSSGYGSEFGSQTSISSSETKNYFLETETIRRTSIPRKSSVFLPEHRSSVPNILTPSNELNITGNDEDDIVFV